MRLLKIGFLSASLLTALWLLAPRTREGKVGDGVVEISFMGPGGPVSGALEDAIRQFEEESARAHEADPSKPVYRVVSGQNASRDQTADPTRFLMSVAGGMPPDVIYFDRFAVTEWAGRGAFLDLTPFIEKNITDNADFALRAEDYYPSCWDEVVFHDPRTGKTGIYGIPEKVDSRALLYNKDLLVRAGYVDGKGEARPPRTWEELEEMAVALTERTPAGYIARLGFVPNYGNSWLYLYGWMNGGEFMSTDGKRCTLDDPQVESALEWMSGIYRKLGGAREVYAFQSSFQGGDLDPFLTGKIGMKIDGFWQITDILSQYGRSVNWAAAPPPVPASAREKGMETLSWVGGWCYAIPSSAKHKEGAWELIRFLSSQRAVSIIAESSRLQAASRGQVFVPIQHSNRVINKFLTEKYVFSNPAMEPRIKDAVRLYNDLLEGARFRPVTPVGQLLWNQHITATENAIFEKSTAHEALSHATANVQRELDRILAPPVGRELSWSWLIAIYVALVVAAVIGIYYWDTRAGLRRGVAHALRHVGGNALLGKGGGIEGVQSSYFRSQWRGGWICAAPWIIGFILFTGGPILFSIVISFCDYDILNPARVTGLKNYQWMFTSDPLFWKSLWNTLFMVLGIPVGLGVSLGIAMLLNMEIRGVALWRTFFYLPSIVPAVAASILWIWIFNPSGGLLNSVLGSLGIVGPNWLQDERTSKLSLILMGLWGAGGGMIIWIAGLKGISQSYYEAADLDGAGPWGKFRHITLPLLSPYIFFNLIMGLIGTFQIFTQAFIMTLGGPVNSTHVYAYHLFNNAFRYLQMGYAAAMAWFLFLIVFILTMIQMRLSERWVHYEGD